MFKTHSGHQLEGFFRSGGGDYLYCNSMFATMVNMSLSKVIGLAFQTFIAPDCIDDFKTIFERGWTQDGKFEISISSQNSLIPCQLSVTTLELDEGVSLSIIITDLTYQKEIQRLLKQNNENLEKTNSALEVSNHDLQQFASVASHDLQEPLRKNLIFSGLLKSRHLQELPEESVEYLEKIIASSGRMKTMYDNHFEITDLNAVIAEVLEDFEILVAD